MSALDPKPTIGLASLNLLYAMHALAAADELLRPTPVEDPFNVENAIAIIAWALEILRSIHAMTEAPEPST